LCKCVQDKINVNTTFQSLRLHSHVHIKLTQRKGGFRPCPKVSDPYGMKIATCKQTGMAT